MVLVAERIKDGVVGASGRGLIVAAAAAVEVATVVKVV